MKLVNSILIALFMVTLAGAVTFGKTSKKQVKFIENINVNGTEVKSGTYDLVFDDTTSELSVLKNGKLVAKTPVHVEARNRKARETEIRKRIMGSDTEFLGITFGGSKEDIVVGSMAMQAGGTF